MNDQMIHPTNPCQCPAKRAKRFAADRALSLRHLQSKYLGKGTHPDYTRKVWMKLLSMKHTAQAYWSWVYECLHTEENCTMEDFDLSTESGMANSVRWTENYISHLKDGGAWLIPRSGTVVTVHHSKRQVDITSLIADPAIAEVFKAMGWTVNYFEV